MTPKFVVLAAVVFSVLSPPLEAGDPGSRVLYVGGTVAGMANKSSARIEILQDDTLKFSTRHDSLLIPYKDVTTLEYGNSG